MPAASRSGATQELCIMDAPCAGGLSSHRANLDARGAAQGHKQNALCWLSMSPCSGAGDLRSQMDHQPATQHRLVTVQLCP